MQSSSSIRPQPAEAVLLNIFLPRATTLQNALLIVAGSLLVGLCAQLSLPLPFSPVPVTGQTFAVLLLGATLGARRAAAALLLYLAEGAAGLPVFAPAGLPGLARLLGPTAGYLWAFPLGAFVSGWVVERLERPNWLGWLGAMAAGDAVIFAVGVAWLQQLAQLNWGAAVATGLLPFLPGEAFKVAVLSLCLPASCWALARPRENSR